MSKINYKFVKEATGAEGDKLPRQANVVLSTLKAMSADALEADEKFDGFISRDALVKNLEEPVGDLPNALNARQPVERVVIFYQKRLVESGYLEMNKPAAAPAEPKAKKAKTPGKTAAKTPPAANVAPLPEGEVAGMAV